MITLNCTQLLTTKQLLSVVLQSGATQVEWLGLSRLKICCQQEWTCWVHGREVNEIIIIILMCLINYNILSGSPLLSCYWHCMCNWRKIFMFNVFLNGHKCILKFEMIVHNLIDFKWKCENTKSHIILQRGSQGFGLTSDTFH